VPENAVSVGPVRPAHRHQGGPLLAPRGDCRNKAGGVPLLRLSGLESSEDDRVAGSCAFPLRDLFKQVGKAAPPSIIFIASWKRHRGRLVAAARRAGRRPRRGARANTEPILDRDGRLDFSGFRRALCWAATKNPCRRTDQGLLRPGPGFDRGCGWGSASRTGARACRDSSRLHTKNVPLAAESHPRAQLTPETPGPGRPA